MKTLLRLPNLLKLTLVFLIALVFQNCTQENIKERTDQTLNITDYLRANPDYSMFLEILDITNYSSFMNTYGTYTLFLPTNDAIKQYLTDVGASSLSQVPLKDLQNLVKLHILEKKIGTTSFTDGKIVVPSMYGQYLITGAANINGVSYSTVNKTSNVLAGNIEAGNGVIHIIDKVLRVADRTLTQTIETDPNLSLFTEILKATGWYDKLNQPITYDSNKVGSYLTVLAQANEVFENTTWKIPGTNTIIKLNTLDNLKLRYSHLHDPLNPADSLNLFVQYHIVPKLNYQADFATTATFETKVPLEIISSKLIKGTIHLNQDVFDGVFEEGVAIVRSPSDATCSNGVLHYLDKNLQMKKRVPMPVYFDACDQPEFVINTNSYRKPGAVQFGYVAPFVNLTWEGDQTMKMLWTPNTTTWNGDQLEVFRFKPVGGQQNVTLTTPIIIKGRYKIWVSYRQNSKASSQVKTFFDGVQMSRTINLQEAANPISGTSYVTDKVLESQGYKRPMYPFVNTSIYSRLVGIVDIAITGRHKITFNAVTDGGQAWFDIIEFRPVDMDQIWPKFKAGLAGAGGLVQRADAPKDN
ncbi:fasciclin domain-containing protein [Flavobacterium sp. WC2509]|uniref:fasciclin domain-containing protein n=1 Tax=Flavobacterium sp. WC2509 TaxID=3461406 RepID=UPI0040440855